MKCLCKKGFLFIETKKFENMAWNIHSTVPVDHVSTDIDWHRNHRYFVQVLIFSGQPKYRWYDVSENFRVLLSARHYAVLVSPNKDETFVHCAHSLGNLAVGTGDVPVVPCIMLLASEKVLGIWALATHPSQHFQGSPPPFSCTSVNLISLKFAL